MIHSKVTVVFCGEEYSVSPETGLTIGRTGDVEVDDNPYLHRTFLVVSFDNGFWWLGQHRLDPDGDGRRRAGPLPGLAQPGRDASRSR